jgi:hypothetical protein
MGRDNVPTNHRIEKTIIGSALQWWTSLNQQALGFPPILYFSLPCNFLIFTFQKNKFLEILTFSKIIKLPPNLKTIQIFNYFQYILNPAYIQNCNCSQISWWRGIRD